MFNNYLRLAFRNLRNHKGHTIINITGLVIGLTCSLLIMLVITSHTSYDSYHQNANSIYRVIIRGQLNNEDFNIALTPNPMGPILESEFPEIETAVRFINQSGEHSEPIKYGDNSIFENNIYAADSNVFDVFAFELLKGDPRNALNAKNSVVISKEIADKLFKEEDPIGKMIQCKGYRELVVSGVMVNVPVKSHFHPKVLISMSTIIDKDPDDFMYWLSVNSYTYFKTVDKAGIDNIKAKLGGFYERHMSEEMGKSGLSTNDFRFAIQPLKSIHLHSDLKREHEANFNAAYLYIYAATAIFLLLIACINFTNLSIAGSLKRSLEVGIRKVTGAHRRGIFTQFLTESFIVVLIAFLLSVAITIFSLESLSNFLGHELALVSLINGRLLLITLAILTFTTICSSAYPSFILAASKPVEIINHKFKSGPRKASLSKALIIFQFTISIALAVSAVFMIDQMQFIRNKRLGFDKENVVTVKLKSDKLFPTLKNELSKIPEVKHVSGMSVLPGKGFHLAKLTPEGDLSNQTYAVLTVGVDADINSALGLEIIAGRNLRSRKNGANHHVLVNETAVKQFGWQDPIGKKLTFVPTDPNENKIDLTVAGVIKDFHFHSVHDLITPIVFTSEDIHELHNVVIRLQPFSSDNSIRKIQDVWKSIDRSGQFEFAFLDDTISKLYRSEERLNLLFKLCTLLTIFTSCIGLFGMASLTIEQRTKEIGIRKTIGATVSEILIMLSTDYTRWLIISNLLAWIMAWYFLKRWLYNFAYHIEISIWPFVFVGIFAIAIALLTISFKAIKASVTNPVNSLKYE